MPWLTLLSLGAFHGVNPAMGWLFAVSNGLQAGSRKGVLRSLPPIGLGHLASVGLVAVLLELTGDALPARAAAVTIGVALMAFGVWRLLSKRHVRWVGMRLGAGGLFAWSFVVATVHGAGLMLAPVLLHRPTKPTFFCPLTIGTRHPGLANGLGAAGIHGAATLAVLSVIAFVIYEVVGLRILQQAWLNLDRIWAFALVGAGMLVAL